MVKGKSLSSWNSKHNLKSNLRAVVTDLERRQLLASAANVFSSVLDSTDGKTSSPVVVSLRSTDFTLSGNSTLLGFRSYAVSGSSANPGTVIVRNIKGKIISPITSANDTAGSTASFGVYNLAAGGYSITVLPQTTGAGSFRVEAYLVGDVNGDHKVDGNDATAHNTLVATSKYSLSADANLDGKINSTDLNLLNQNLGDATTLSLSSNTKGIGTAPDTFNHSQRSSLVIPSLGVLQNDWVQGFFDVLNITADTSSAHGAIVSINPDGGFVWDPKGNAELVTLAPGKTIDDTFSYTVTNSAGFSSTSKVTVHYTGSLTRDDDHYTTDENTRLTVPASLGLLINDGDPAHPQSLKVIKADFISAHGAAVSVLPDGSFTYDPSNVPEFQNLKEGEIIDDSFAYVISGAVVGYGNIAVVGKADGAEDVYSITPDKVLTIPAKGVLKNDGTGAFIKSFQTATTFGVPIVLKADGSFVYDAEHVEEFRAISVGETEYDRFDYTYVASGKIKTTTVTIAVNGLNDNPLPQNDSFDVSQDTVLSPTHSLLFNDSDPDDHVRLYVSNYQATSELGATITVKSNGKFTYDPRNGELLKILSRNETLIDTFTYTVSDGKGGSATAVVHVSVAGIDHGVTAKADSYEILESHELIKRTSDGLFANDLNPDRTDKLHLTKFDATSKYGAEIEVFDDGSFEYDPATSSKLEALHAGEVLTDSFTYTVNDAHGHSSIATVSIKVIGETHEPDDQYGVYTTHILTVDGEGVMANDPVHNGTIIKSPTVSKLGGKVVMKADGTFTYDPSTISSTTLNAAIAKSAIAGVAIDSFQYTAKDGTTGKTNTQTVSIEVMKTTPAIEAGLDAQNNAAPAARMSAMAVTAQAVPEIAGYGSFFQPSALIVNGILTINSPYRASYFNTVGVQIELVADTPETIRVETAIITSMGGSSDPRFYFSTQFTSLGTFKFSDFSSVKYTGSPFDDKFMLPTMWQYFSRPLNIDMGGGYDSVYGGAGNDTINGGEGRDEIWGNGGDDVINGGENDDILQGGSGGGVINGDAGNDVLNSFYGNQTLNGGAGADQFVTSPERGSLMVEPKLSDGDEFTIHNTDFVSGIKSERQSDDDLQMVGNLDARRTAQGVMVNGPSLYGFNILGTFSRVPFLGGEKFVATSIVTIKAGSISIPIPSNSFTPLTVTTSADSFTDVGHVTGIDFGGLLNLSTSNPSDPLATFLNTFGLKLGGLGNDMGIKLGKDLASIGGPLNPAIPYFFIHKQLGGSVVSFGENAVNTAQSGEIALVVDLADPFMYVKANAPIGGFAFGGSFKGYIPFAAKQVPGIFAPSNGEVLLKNATATYAQAGYDASKVIDLVDTGNNGWAVFGGTKTTQKLVVQSIAPTTADEFTFVMRFNNPYTDHKIQKFRIYYTKDANPTATNSSINWLPLNPLIAKTSRSDSDAITTSDSAIQITGSKAQADTYEVMGVDFSRETMKGVTGFMIEALPGANGQLGFADAGNFVLNEIEVHGRTNDADDGPQLYGNMFAHGNLSLTSMQVPLSVSGDILIDLDANDDGSVLGLKGNTASRLFSGKDKLSDVLLTALNDVRVGVNGQVNAELDIGKSGLGLSLPLASATAIFKNRTFAYKGATAQPFQGTALDFIKTQSMSSEGYITLDGDVGFKASMEPGKVGPFSMGGAKASLEINNNGALFQASYQMPIVKAEIGIGGSIDRNGLFELYAGASASFEAGPLTIRGSMNARVANFRWSGSSKISAGGVVMSAAIDVFGSVTIIDAGMRGSIEFSVGSGGLLFSGTGEVYGSWPSFSIRAGLSNSGFYIVTPDGLPNITVRW